MMRLYVSARSPFVREVLIAICELRLAGTIDLVPALVRMDQPNETVLATNPLGKIPALTLDDGTAVGGTLPIIDELDRRAGGDLLPTARIERSWHLRHHAVSHGLLEVLVLWRNERDKPPAQQDSGWLANFEAKTAITLDAIERSVPEMSATAFGLAHISLAALAFYPRDLSSSRFPRRWPAVPIAFRASPRTCSPALSCVASKRSPC